MKLGLGVFGAAEQMGNRHSLFSQLLFLSSLYVLPASRITMSLKRIPLQPLP